MNTLDHTEAGILTVLKQLHAASTMGLSAVTHVFLYLPDPTGTALEPIFMVPARPYKGVRPAFLGQAEQFIAGIAYENNTRVWVEDPATDKRIGRAARQLIRHYRITGSILAEPVRPLPVGARTYPTAPQGILVVCGNTRVEERRIQHGFWSRFNNTVLTLSALLSERDAAVHQRLTAQYDTISTHALRSLSHLIPPSAYLRQFAATVRRQLLAEGVYLVARNTMGQSVEHATGACRPLKRCQRNTLTQALDRQGAITLNRPDADPDLFNLLTPPGRTLVWTGVRREDAGETVYCCACRQAETVAQHWSREDMSFLTSAARLLLLAIRRVRGFEAMLTQLRRYDMGAPQPRFAASDFRYLYHICKDFFDVDQVLLVRIHRQGSDFHIKGESADGFGPNNDWIVKVTDRILTPFGRQPRRPDVLPYILRQYLRTTGKRGGNGLQPIYHAGPGNQEADFTLDPEVVKRIPLKGRVYFLPCLSVTKDETPILRSIVHLGQSRGHLLLPKSMEPLLQGLAASVADGLARREEEARGAMLRTVRCQEELTIDSLRTILENATSICESIACTLFVKVSLAHLVGWRTPTDGQLSSMWQRYLRHVSHIGPKRIPTDGAWLTVRAMLAAFLGVEEKHVERLVRQPRIEFLAALLARNLYVQVAQENCPLPSDTFTVPMEAHGKPEEAEFVKRFGDLVATRSYLPGYGLTGWALRYSLDLCLPRKTKRSIQAYFRTLNTDGAAFNPREILAYLELTGVESVFRTVRLIPPYHADHIKEKADFSRQPDPYLACILESVDDAVSPAGILRTSTSVTLKTQFQSRDQENLHEVAQHLSWMLRRGYSRQQEFVRERVAKAKLHRYYVHTVGHLTKGLSEISAGACVRCRSSRRLRDGLEEVADVKARLSKHDRFERLVGSVSRLQVATVSDLRAYLAEFLEQTRRGLPILIEPAPNAPERVPCANFRSCLAEICFLLDEVVENSCKHTRDPRPRRLAVTVMSDPLAVTVKECASTSRSSRPNGTEIPAPRQPYIHLLTGGGQNKGMGSAVVRDILATTGLAAWYECQGDWKLYGVECSKDCRWKMTLDSGHASEGGLHE